MNQKEFAVKILAPEIEPKLRHKKIFAVFDLLDSGQQLELTNDIMIQNHCMRSLRWTGMETTLGSTWRKDQMFGALQ